MKTKLYFSLLAAILLLGGCEKSDPTTDQSGNVVLCNDDGLLSSHDNIKVSIEGTDLSTFTDASGNWTIKGVKAASQTVVFEKTGFGTYKDVIVPSLDHANNMNSFELPILPAFSIKNLEAKLVAGGNVEVKGEFTVPPIYSFYRTEAVFFGKTSSISGDPSTWLYSPTTIGSTDSTYTISTSISELYQNGFAAGNTVYIISYGTSNRGNKSYFDEKTQKYVYGCLSTTPSNVVSIQLP